MKPKRKAALFPSKPKATQRRNSLQRVKDEVLRRDVRILLSPIPYHLSRFRISRKSITNFSPRRSVTLINRPSTSNEAKHADEPTAKSLHQTPIVKSPRKRSRRKNEAEKLQELSSKICISDDNIFRSRRALRSRLILTPKSPLVRVKKIKRESVKSRKLSPTLINKFMGRDFFIELEKLPINENSSEKEADKDLSVEEPQPEIEQNVTAPQVETPKRRDIAIVLEKLEVEPEEGIRVSDVFTQRSEENLSHLKSPNKNEAEISTVSQSSKDVPLREFRILLEKLPDTILHPISEPSRIHEIDTEHIIDDLSNITSSDSSKKQVDDIDSKSEDDRSIDKPSQKPSTPSQKADPLTPAAVSKSLSTPATTPTPKMIGSGETSDKKTPKSLDIPLCRVTIVKSKFSKLNRALQSPEELSPIKTQLSSRYLFSASPKSYASKINKTTTKIPWSNSRSEPSIPAVVSPSHSQVNVAEIPQTASSPSYIWKGMLVMLEVAKCNVVLKKVSGNCEGLADDIHSGLNCIGRISPYTVWEYLSKVRKVNRKDILVLRLESVETKDELDYQKLYSYLCARNRLAVVGHTGPAIKNFYVLPLARNSSVPEVLLPLDGPGFENSRPNLLLAIVVRSRLRHCEDLHLAHPHIRRSHPIGSILDANKHTESKSEKTPPTSQSTPSCTEVVSPLSRGQLLMQKSLASSPNPRQVLLIKSSQNVRSPKHRLSNDSSAKTPVKSPMNRGRLLMEQSLAASPNSSKEISRSVSVGSTLNRSYSSLSSDKRESNDNAHKQKWASAGDLLKTSLKEKDQGMNAKPDSSKDTSPIASPLDPVSTTGVFSNEKTCTAVLSTLKITDRNKSKSTPDVNRMPKGSIKSPSSSQDNLLQKLAKVKIDSKKPSVAEQPKNNFHIPKVKPGLSTSTRIPTAPSTSLPRSGFTPSPPTKSTFTQSVLNLGNDIPNLQSISAYSRKLPSKPSQSTSSTRRSAKSTLNTPPRLTKSSSSSGSQTLTFKPTFSSSSQPSSLTNPSSSFSLKVIPPYTSTPQLPTEPSQSSSSDVFAKPYPVHSKDPRSVKFLPTLSQTKSNQPLQTPQSKPHIAAKPKPVTPSNRSSHTSKSGGLKVAYMGSRSSNNASFSKYLPSGPQYSPSYSKYLQNGFHRLPDANIPPKPKPPKPTDPATSSVLGWSSAQPWRTTKSANSPKPSSASLVSKSTNAPAGPTTSVPAAYPVKPPTGPTGSLTSSVFTSNPEYSPLCPQFDF